MKKRVSDIDIVPGERFKKHEVPVFDREISEATTHGFTEISSEQFLGFEDDNILVVRYNDPDGIDPNNCIYHAYKKEIGADGNFTGNAKAIESIDGKAKPYNLTNVFARAKLHKRNKP